MTRMRGYLSITLACVPRDAPSSLLQLMNSREEIPCPWNSEARARERASKRAAATASETGTKGRAIMRRERERESKGGSTFHTESDARIRSTTPQTLH